MKANPQLAAQMNRLVSEAISQIPADGQEDIITDFHIQTNSDNGDVVITDDNDHELARTTVEGYEEMNDDEFREHVAKALRQELMNMNRQKKFDRLRIFRPFSFVLADDDKESLEDLMVIDSENVMVNDELLKGLDEELDAFLQDLLKD